MLKASESEIPKFDKAAQKSPSNNDDFLTLIEARNLCKNPMERKQLGVSIKKMRNKLKNEYFFNLAYNINIANEERKIEEEFRLCKDYKMHKNSDTKLITNKKLTEFLKTILKIKILSYNRKWQTLWIIPIFYRLKPIPHLQKFQQSLKYRML